MLVIQIVFGSILQSNELTYTTHWPVVQARAWGRNSPIFVTLFQPGYTGWKTMDFFSNEYLSYLAKQVKKRL